MSAFPPPAAGAPEARATPAPAAPVVGAYAPPAAGAAGEAGTADDVRLYSPAAR
jgi:hypothetical protein